MAIFEKKPISKGWLNLDNKHFILPYGFRMGLSKKTLPSHIINRFFDYKEISSTANIFDWFQLARFKQMLENFIFIIKFKCY